MSSSLRVWLLVAVVAALALFQDRRWKPLEVLDWDGGGYYAYLPAAFLYHDLGRADSLERLHKAYHPGRPHNLGLVHLPNGRVIPKYPLGVALAELPWFAGAHAYARSHGDAPDGFSRPYQQAVMLSGLFYGLLGLWVLRQLLRRYYDDRTTAWTLAGIGLGTNLLVYLSYEAQMVHAYLFLWQAALLYCTARWYETRRPGFAAGIGLFLGLAVLSRPTEALYALVPLAWGLRPAAAGRERLGLLARHGGQVLLAVAVAAAVGSLQLLFWRATSGHWLLYSYGHERFDFQHPHLLEGLFGFSKGWLLYTPLAGLALLGSVFLRRYVAPAGPVLLVLVPVVVYVTFSWEQWQYGGGFSARPLISLYPLLALPMAALVATALQRRWPARVLPLLLVLVALNLWQTWQFAAGVIPDFDNTRAQYLHRFFQLSLH